MTPDAKQALLNLLDDANMKERVKRAEKVVRFPDGFRGWTVALGEPHNRVFISLDNYQGSNFEDFAMGISDCGKFVVWKRGWVNL